MIKTHCSHELLDEVRHIYDRHWNFLILRSETEWEICWLTCPIEKVLEFVKVELQLRLSRFIPNTILPLKLITIFAWRFRSKHGLADAHRVKFHLVTGQGSSFISKHVVHHTEILDDAQVSNFCLLRSLLTYHMYVSIDVTRNYSLKYLDWDKERSW